MKPMPTPRIISTRRVTPATPPPVSKIRLTPWDVMLFSVHYIQKGLLFATSATPPLVGRLFSSLTAALDAFYPLAGRLVTVEGSGGYAVLIDCGEGDGVEFIHAAIAGVAVDDVVGDGDEVPALLNSFFPLTGAVSCDGHTLPLLVVQVTELADGVFVGCAFNHAVGDGTSFWNFFNAWAELSRHGVSTLSPPPAVHDRQLVDQYLPSPVTLLPIDPSVLIERFSSPPIRERIFHFSAASLAELVAKANTEITELNGGEIAGTVSRFQALSSLLWRSIARARKLPLEEETICRLAIDNRHRLRPPLPPNYFGNALFSIVVKAVAGELNHGLAAAVVRRAVTEHTDRVIREKLAAWAAAPIVYTPSMISESTLMIGSSPRFDMYGCDFGWGKAVAVKSASANKFDGKVSLFPGIDGGGSIDAEVCLSPEKMAALEEDEEFSHYITN